jgi:hypothetical protein
MVKIDEFTSLVLDTNILNHIFTQHIREGKAILSLLKKYKANIWIPSTVYREYKLINFEELIKKKKKEFKNSSANIKNAYQTILIEMYKLQNNSKSNGFFELDSYLSEAIDRLENNKKKEVEEINSIQNEVYCERLAELMNDVDALVDELYKNGQVGENFTVKEIIEICNEGKIRYDAEIPPGFSDNGKKRGYTKYNDLFIWKEIIRLASQYEKNKIIFLTDDLKKGNWWVNPESKERKITPILKQEFEELCPGNYEEKTYVNIEFLTLSDFIRNRKVLDFSLFEMDKQLLLHEIKNLYKDDIEGKLCSFVCDIDPGEIDDMFSYPNNAGEIEYEDLIVDSYDIEEDEGGFYCQMTASQKYYYNVAYEDNEGDVFNFGDAILRLRAAVIVQISNDGVEKVLFLEKGNSVCELKHINYEIESCETYLDD